MCQVRSDIIQLVLNLQSVKLFCKIGFCHMWFSYRGIRMLSRNLWLNYLKLSFYNEIIFGGIEKIWNVADYSQPLECKAGE